MSMVAPTGRRGAKSDQRQRRIGGLASRLNGSRRRYEWLVKAFPHAPAPLLAEATSRLRRTRYRRGDVIVAEGEPADQFYIVTSGEAEVIQRVQNRDVYVSTVAPGQYFGEVGLLASRPRNATVRAVSDLEVLSLNKETFRQVADHSETAEDLEQVLSVRSARSTPPRRRRSLASLDEVGAAALQTPPTHALQPADPPSDGPERGSALVRRVASLVEQPRD